METYYIKVGKRYRPISECQTEWLALPQGNWLLTSKPGCKSVRKLPDRFYPDYVGLVAAANEMREAMLEAMRKENELRPSRRAVSPKEQAAWETFKKTMGKDVPSYFECGSLASIIDAGINGLLSYANHEPA